MLQLYHPSVQPHFPFYNYESVTNHYPRAHCTYLTLNRLVHMIGHAKLRHSHQGWEVGVGDLLVQTPQEVEVDDQVHVA